MTEIFPGLSKSTIVENIVSLEHKGVLEIEDRKDENLPTLFWFRDDFVEFMTNKEIFNIKDIKDFLKSQKEFTSLNDINKTFNKILTNRKILLNKDLDSLIDKDFMQFETACYFIYLNYLNNHSVDEIVLKEIFKEKNFKEINIKAV